MSEQYSFFEEDPPCAEMCCYTCAHFAELKEPRLYDGFGVYGICMRSYNKNGSTTVYPIYVPGGVCKNYKKRRADI